MKNSRARAEIFPHRSGRQTGFYVRWVGPRGEAMSWRWYTTIERAHEIAQLCGAEKITDVEEPAELIVP